MSKCLWCGKKIYDKAERKLCKLCEKKLPNIQPCWICKKYAGGCSWSKNLIPVEGWIAEEVVRENSNIIDDVGYKITYCPEFVCDEIISCGGEIDFTKLNIGRRKKENG